MISLKFSTPIGNAFFIALPPSDTVSHIIPYLSLFHNPFPLTPATLFPSAKSQYFVIILQNIESISPKSIL